MSTTRSTSTVSWPGTRALGAAAIVLVLVGAACANGNGPADGRDRATAPAAPDETPSTTDGENASAEPGNGAAPRYASGDDDYLFDQEQLHTFELNVSEESLAELNLDPAAEEYVEGSLTFDGETIERIGVRYKGSIGAFINCTEGPNPFEPSGAKKCTKLSLKLKMNWDDPKATFYGVRRVQLHSQNLDPTLMRERLGYWLFREMGVAAPRSTHARVIVNGEYIGVYALTEQIDGRFTRANFEDGTGNLYKEIWPLDGDGAPQPADAFVEALETNKSEASADLITSFAEELAAAAPEDRLEVVDRWTDLDALLTAFVVDRAIGNEDGALHWYCLPECAPHNFYWYEDPSTRELSFIPWDLDNAFDLYTERVLSPFVEIADAWGSTSNNCEPFPFGGYGLLQRSAACDPLIGTLATLNDDFDRIRAELVAGPFSKTSVDAQIAAWTAQIEPSVAEASALHVDAPTVERWDAAVDRLIVGIDEVRTSDGR